MSQRPLAACSGKRFRIEGEAAANIPVIVNTGGYAAIVNEAHAKFTWEGKTAYGISEFMGSSAESCELLASVSSLSPCINNPH